MSKNNITINDVAKAAGVSKATVSRYLNGKTKLMTKETSERIENVIELLNYRPSEVARSLKSRKTKTIGVILADIRSPFYAALLSGIEEKLIERDYSAIFVNSGKSHDTELKNVTSFLSRNVDGILINTTSFNNEELIAMTANRIPMVLIDRYINNHNFSVVTIDNEKMFDLIFDHLQSQGYNRFAFIVGQWKSNSTRIKRRNLFLKNMKERFGVDAENDVYAIHTDFPTYGDGVDAFLTSLKAGDRPCIIGSNSDATFSVYHALIERGIKIPEQVGIIGPEDWSLGRDMAWPDVMATPLTTIAFDSVGIGRKAAELIIERIEHPENELKEIKMPVELYIRESTKGTGIKK